MGFRTFPRSLWWPALRPFETVTIYLATARSQPFAALQDLPDERAVCPEMRSLGNTTCTMASQGLLSLDPLRGPDRRRAPGRQCCHRLPGRNRRLLFHPAKAVTATTASFAGGNKDCQFEFARGNFTCAPFTAATAHSLRVRFEPTPQGALGVSNLRLFKPTNELRVRVGVCACLKRPGARLKLDRSEPRTLRHRLGPALCGELVEKRGDVKLGRMNRNRQPLRDREAGDLSWIGAEYHRSRRSVSPKLRSLLRLFPVDRESRLSSIARSTCARRIKRAQPGR